MVRAQSLAFVLALLALSPATRTASLQGGPGCPGSCPNVCGISTQNPTNTDTACVVIEATWTRLQDGCAENPSCTPCRQCLGRLRVTLTASAACVQSEGGYVKNSWETQARDATTPPPPWTSTGSGTGALAPQPDGSAASVDTRDVLASCGQDAEYTGTATTGNGNSESVTASYHCDACSPS